MREWSFGNTRVKLQLGPVDDREMDIVVKAGTISLSGESHQPLGSIKIDVREQTSARRIEYWPAISQADTQRRRTIYNTVRDVLMTAEKERLRVIGLYTTGLEMARIPSWEVAEETVRALNAYARRGDLSVETVYIVVSSPTQLMSFEYALDNVESII